MICPSCGSENLEGNDRCENCLASFRDLDVPGADKAEGLARHVMEDTLSDLHYEDPIVVTPDTPALEVARRMKEANSGCALVLDGPRLVGIFTEHDVLTTLCKSSQSALQTATSGVQALEPEEMDQSVLPPLFEEVPMIDSPFADIPSEEIRSEEQFTAEPPRGTTETLHVGQRLSALQVPVKDLMSRDPETLHESESIAVALNKMSMGRFRHIPIEKKDGSYTVASIKSVFNYIAQKNW